MLGGGDAPPEMIRSSQVTTDSRRQITDAQDFVHPHTAAKLDLDQIWNLVDDLIEAHGSWLPAYD